MLAEITSLLQVQSPAQEAVGALISITGSREMRGVGTWGPPVESDEYFYYIPLPPHSPLPS